MENTQLILASGSPRRKEILTLMGYHFQVMESNIPELIPERIPAKEVPAYLAKAKIDHVKKNVLPNQVILAADTIVLSKDKILGKPQNRNEAIAMLQALSDTKHEVITAVYLTGYGKESCFSDSTTVWFNRLTEDQILYYVNQYKPYDKAGGYAIQEWIGLTGISKIEGCYFNVVGLPASRVYTALQAFGIFPVRALS